MATQFKGRANIGSDQFYDLAVLISGSASVDGYVTVLGPNSAAVVDTSSGTQPSATDAYAVLVPNVPYYVNAAHIWVKSLNGKVTVQFQQIA